MLSQQICALLVQNLERLDEAVKEEAEGVHNTLGKYYILPKVIQNFVLKMCVCVCVFLILVTVPKVVSCLVYSSPLRTEVIYYPPLSVDFRQPTWCYSSEDRTPQMCLLFTVSLTSQAELWILVALNNCINHSHFQDQSH